MPSLHNGSPPVLIDKCGLFGKGWYVSMDWDGCVGGAWLLSAPRRSFSAARALQSCRWAQWWAPAPVAPPQTLAVQPRPICCPLLVSAASLQFQIKTCLQYNSSYFLMQYLVHTIQEFHFIVSSCHLFPASLIQKIYLQIISIKNVLS